MHGWLTFRPMLGMVFAAGLGTRLRPLTDRLPKPVVPFMNRPLAAYSIERLAAAGVQRVAVNTHHLAKEVPKRLEGELPDDLEVRFIEEPELLGTGGGLRNALLELLADKDDEGPFLVMNGDILFWPDVEAALAVHERHDAVATVILRPHPRARQLGAFALDPDGRARQLLGSPDYSGPVEELMFTGVHVLSKRALADLPERGCIIRTAYRTWIDRGDAPGNIVAGVVDRSPWRDLGTPRAYLDAHLDAARGELTWPGRPYPAQAKSDVVLGPGAVVAEGVTLKRCVVWGGATVTESHTDCIITPHASVAVTRDSG